MIIRTMCYRSQKHEIYFSLCGKNKLCNDGQPARYHPSPFFPFSFSSFFLFFYVPLILSISLICISPTSTSPLSFIPSYQLFFFPFILFFYHYLFPPSFYRFGLIFVDPFKSTMTTSPGGTSRVSIVKRRLGEILGLDSSAINYGLKTTMNSDEAVARGEIRSNQIKSKSIMRT